MANTVISIKMNDENFDLKLTYLAIYDEEPGELIGLQHLQAVRIGISGGHIEESYKSLEPELTSMLVNELSNMSFEYIIAPPSKYPFARKYVDEIVKSKNINNNLSDYIIPNDKRKRATGSASVNELLSSWNCNKSFIIPSGASILLVDDIVNTGSTFGALIQLLSQSELNQCLSFHAVAPLWIKSTNKHLML